MDQYVNSWYRNGGIDSSEQLHYKHISSSPSNISIAAFEGDLDTLWLAVYNWEWFPSVVACYALMLSWSLSCAFFLAWHSRRWIAALLPCIQHIKTVLIARISWESSCSSEVASSKRTTSFVVWRESIYWMRSKAKRQSRSRWVTTISKTIPRLVRSNNVLSPGHLKLTPDPISLMSS